MIVEWLGGEPLLRSSIYEHMEHARRLGLRNNMWTGGLPLHDPACRRRTAELCRNGLISVHVSTVDPELYRRLHPGRDPDDLRRLLDGVRATLDLGYPAARMLDSITFTGLQPAEDTVATIDSFLMSCRVMNRTVEQAMLRDAVELASARGCQTLRGEYIATDRNAIVREFFTNNGFSALADSSNFELHLGEQVELPAWPDVIHREQ